MRVSTISRAATSVPSTSNAPYLQNEGLLFQFILHEFLRICNLIKEPPKAAIFKKLIGDAPIFIDSPTFNWGRGGSLRRLHSYITLLIYHFPEKNSLDELEMKQLVGTAHKACLSAIKADKLLKTDQLAFEKEQRLLKRHVKKIASLLPKRMELYKTNESVLLFLLQRQESFRFVYGTPVIATLFKSLFSDGIKEAGQYILDAYSQRGFTHLLPKIRSLILTLEQSV